MSQPNNPKIELKKKYTMIFLDFVYEWYWNTDDNDLSKIKILLLLFLVAAHDKKLLEIFDNFEAWTYWPIEGDVYKILEDWIDSFSFNNKQLIKKCKINIEKNKINKIKIKNKLNEIKDKINERNPNLIGLELFDLIDIIHQWSSWRLTYYMDWIKEISSAIILKDKKKYWL